MKRTGDRATDHCRAFTFLIRRYSSVVRVPLRQVVRYKNVILKPFLCFYSNQKNIN